MMRRDASGCMFTWPGKDKAYVLATIGCKKRLQPLPEESRLWDTTDHVYVKGDNLDSLRLLLPIFGGKVKMIYLDPPYNTGKSLCYPDRFSRTCWCNLLLPRLLLLRQMLRDDGVLFCSIGEESMAMLRLLCDEVFGPENFVDTLIWRKLYGGKNDSRYFVHCHDYILVYAKDKSVWRPNLVGRSDTQNKRYQNPDGDPRGSCMSSDFSHFGPTPGCVYEIVAPNGKVYVPKEGKRWITTYERYVKLRADNRIWFGKSGGAMPRLKRFLSEVKSGVSPSTFLDYSEVGHSDEANKELQALLGGVYFDYPKPVRLLSYLCQIGMGSDDICLFSFSCDFGWLWYT